MPIAGVGFDVARAGRDVDRHDTVAGILAGLGVRTGGLIRSGDEDRRAEPMADERTDREGTDGYRLDVADFGPISSACIDVRPLTVFVGPSNTGKSYLAILLYALHRSFGGRDGLLRFGFRPFGRGVATSIPLDASIRENLKDWFSAVPDQESSSSPPSDVDALVRSTLENTQDLDRSLREEMRRCYGVSDLNDLVRRPGANGVRVELIVPRNGVEGGRYRFTFGPRDGPFSGAVSGVAPAPIDRRRARFLVRRAARYQKPGFDSGDDYDDLLATFDESENAALLALLAGRTFRGAFRRVFRDACYLPADRTGVMHSHQVVVSTLVQSATTAGLRPSTNVPMLSGVLADFLSVLIGIDAYGRRRTRSTALETSLETNLLGGAIRLDPSDTGYPTFAYRPRGWTDDLPLMRASSMVSELAPVVLYLRHIVKRGDIVIIEEPEAHLHPAMQAAFARELARLVRAGVRIVMTTHSEWFLEQIGNLVRLSKLPENKREGLDGADCALRPEEVGAWLFESAGASQGSVVREVTLDSETGLYPTDYDAVSETLYNQSARIFNRLEEGGGR